MDTMLKCTMPLFVSSSKLERLPIQVISYEYEYIILNLKGCRALHTCWWNYDLLRCDGCAEVNSTNVT